MYWKPVSIMILEWLLYGLLFIEGSAGSWKFSNVWLSTYIVPMYSLWNDRSYNYPIFRNMCLISSTCAYI